MTDTVRLLSWRRPRTYPRFEIDPIPGTYRIDFARLRSLRQERFDYWLSDPLPEAQRVSNTFALRLP